MADAHVLFENPRVGKDRVAERADKLLRPGLTMRLHVVHVKAVLAGV